MSRAQQDALYALRRYALERAETAPPGAAQKAAAIRSEMYGQMADEPEQAADIFRRLDGLEDAPVSVKQALEALRQPNRVLRDLPQTDTVYRGADGLLSVTIRGELAYGLLDTDRLLADIRAAREVRLLIESAGGDCNTALALWSALQGKCTEAVVYKRCWSSATLLLLAAPVRKVTADALIMVHQPYCFLAGQARAIRAKADEMEELAECFRLVYSEHCPDATVERWLDGADHWLTAEQALASGLATEICRPINPHPLAED